MGSSRSEEMMSGVPSRIRAYVDSAVTEVIAQEYPRNGEGREFTYDRDIAAIVGILMGLADEIYVDCRRVVAEVSGELGIDTAEGLAAIFGESGWADLRRRIDGHCSRLLWLLEAALAAGFEEGLSFSELVREAQGAVRSPNTSKLISDARKKGGFTSSYVTDGDLSARLGILSSPLAALTLLVQWIVSASWTRIKLLWFRRRGATGYRVIRHSNYPCPVCAAAAAVIHPIDDIVVPLHPNCVCTVEAVYDK